MHPIILKQKQQLKELALKIKTNRPIFKEWQRGNKPQEKWNWPNHLSSEYRVKHIAYCLVRGTEMNLIESKNKPGNSLNENQYLKKQVDALVKEIQNEIVCYNEGGSKQESTSGPSGACVSAVPPGESGQKSVPIPELGQRDLGVPESAKPGFFARAKEFFGIV